MKMTPIEYEGKRALRYLFGREFFRKEPTVEEVEEAISQLSNAEEIYKKLSGIVYKSHYWVLDLYGEHIINEVIHIYNSTGEPCASDLKSYDDFLDGLVDEIAYSRQESKWLKEKYKFGQKPTSDREALINGLVLAVTATTDAKSDECLALVKQISSSMNELEIADCKREADKILEGITNGS